jgi:hypothetical protein
MIESTSAIPSAIVITIPSATTIEPNTHTDRRPIHGCRVVRIAIRNHRRRYHHSRSAIESPRPMEPYKNPLRLCSRSRCHQQTTSQRRRCQHLDCVELHSTYLRCDVCQFHFASSCTALKSAVQLDKRNPTHRVARNFFATPCSTPLFDSRLQQPTCWRYARKARRTLHVPHPAILRPRRPLAQWSSPSTMVIRHH